MHTCVGDPETTCQVHAGALGLREMESDNTTPLGEGTQDKHMQGNSSEGRDSEHEHKASPPQKPEDSVTLTHGLEVECHHLTADVPEHLGHVVGGVHPGAFGVDPAHLSLVVSTVALLETSLEHSLGTLGIAHVLRPCKLFKLYYQRLRAFQTRRGALATPGSLPTPVLLHDKHLAALVFTTAGSILSGTSVSSPKATLEDPVSHLHTLYLS